MRIGYNQYHDLGFNINVRRTDTMIKYEKGKTKKITISILAGDKFKLRKTNLDEV